MITIELNSIYGTRQVKRDSKPWPPCTTARQMQLSSYMTSQTLKHLRIWNSGPKVSIAAWIKKLESEYCFKRMELQVFNSFPAICLFSIYLKWKLNLQFLFSSSFCCHFYVRSVKEVMLEPYACMLKRFKSRFAPVLYYNDTLFCFNQESGLLMYTLSDIETSSWYLILPHCHCCPFKNNYWNHFEY